MINYKLINSNYGTLTCIQRFSGENASVWTKDELYISLDSDNTDYQEYLAWIAEGNTPEPADE